ncbi:hypothetical protein R80B4_02563 [Fibrobacteres bacterium R8-0-B4]
MHSPDRDTVKFMSFSAFFDTLSQRSAPFSGGKHPFSPRSAPPTAGSDPSFPRSAAGHAASGRAAAAAQSVNNRYKIVANSPGHHGGGSGSGSDSGQGGGVIHPVDEDKEVLD